MKTSYSSAVMQSAYSTTPDDQVTYVCKQMIIIT